MHGLHQRANQELGTAVAGVAVHTVEGADFPPEPPSLPGPLAG